MTDNELERKRASAARTFDVRRVIGGLFTAYGVIITLVGVFDGPDEIAKAEASGSTSGWASPCSPWASSSSPGSGSAPPKPPTPRPRTNKTTTQQGVRHEPYPLLSSAPFRPMPRTRKHDRMTREASSGTVSGTVTA